MIENIDHLAIKVSNLEDVCRAFENLGMMCNRIEKYDEVGMRIAFFNNGQTSFELLEPTEQDSPIINDKAGFHHLGLKVKDIEAVYAKMERDSHYKLEGAIRKGAHSRIFFFKIVGQEEALFECVE